MSAIQYYSEKIFTSIWILSWNAVIQRCGLGHLDTNAYRFDRRPDGNDPRSKLASSLLRITQHMSLLSPCRTPTISLVYPGRPELISSAWGIHWRAVVFQTLTDEKSFAGRTGRGVDISGTQCGRFINTWTRGTPAPSRASIRKTLGRKTPRRARTI